MLCLVVLSDRTSLKTPRSTFGNVPRLERIADMHVCCAYGPGLLICLEKIEGNLPEHEVDGFSLALSVAPALSLYMTLVFFLL